MNIQEYLKQCSVKSVDELTDEQVVTFYTNGNAGIAQKCAVELALQNYSECGFTKYRHIIFRFSILPNRILHAYTTYSHSQP